jgi:hypothetical protein
MNDETRKWTMESGEGRLDVNGVEWFACDPYPTWYRYGENGELYAYGHLEPLHAEWADEA